VTMPRTSIYPCCRLIKSGIATEFLPWDFVLDCFSTPLQGMVRRSGEKTTQFEVGNLNGDVVWLVGDYDDKGIFKCSRLKHPVINLEIANVADDNMITSEYLMTSTVFRRFIRLLTYAYGINAGIHVMFDNNQENPFDRSETGFIEF